MLSKIRPIHPFPARMAPELAWEELPEGDTPCRILDPMTGSGTTLVAARLRGHEAIGFDRDPLAILIAKTWSSTIEGAKVQKKAAEVLKRAEKRFTSLTKRSAFPAYADDETKNFLEFWFDTENRKQLTALSDCIQGVRDDHLRDILWCALSRLIITKDSGVSLAMDVSHSRPHRVYESAPHLTFERFIKAVNYIVKASPFTSPDERQPISSVTSADARKMPLSDGSIDLIITSPPYLNAIDYLRGHKLSLVWMGHSIASIRMLRSTNVGTESSFKGLELAQDHKDILKKVCSGAALSSRNEGMLNQYLCDLRLLLQECHRVLVAGGKGVFVIGNCNLRETYISNSEAIELLGLEAGFSLEAKRQRPLPENRRYLPPPKQRRLGKLYRSECAKKSF